MYNAMEYQHCRVVDPFSVLKAKRAPILASKALIARARSTLF
jgi:hypothetical protein